MKKIVRIFVVLLFAILLTSCVAKPKFDQEKFSVVFYTDGGNSIDSIRFLQKGDKIEEPEKPTKSGAVFLGWYKDQTFNEKFDFQSFVIEKSITIYALWEYRDFTITYELNGGVNNELNPLTFNMSSGNIVLRDPSREGFLFRGWYTEEDFSSSSRITMIKVNEVDYDVKIFARWVSI